MLIINQSLGLREGELSCWGGQFCGEATLWNSKPGAAKHCPQLKMLISWWSFRTRLWCKTQRWRSWYVFHPLFWKKYDENVQGGKKLGGDFEPSEGARSQQGRFEPETGVLVKADTGMVMKMRWQQTWPTHPPQMAQLVVKMLKRREALRQEAHTTLVGDKTITILKMKRMNRIVDGCSFWSSFPLQGWSKRGRLAAAGSSVGGIYKNSFQIKIK